MSARHIERVIPIHATRDGAGVNLLRSIGYGASQRLDPFLLLDYFSSDNPDDYIAGFPPHPHRGFETVTYMLDGSMLHRDHMGNEGILRSGGVQWMTAGRGVIHEERPQQQDGLLRGFQLWVNLPARDKMQPANYQNIEPEQIPQIHLDNGVVLHLIAGDLALGGQTYQGAVRGIAIEPLYLDVQIPANQVLTLPIAAELQAFVYAFTGQGCVEGDELAQGANVLSAGDELTLQAGEAGVRLLVIAGLPLHEPVAQYGPFVMNTQAEVEQAMQDYRQGNLV